MEGRSRWMKVVLFATTALMSGTLFAGAPDKATDDAAMSVYDDTTYTQYVEDTMKKLDKLYLEFCSTCGKDTADAWTARQEFLVTVRDLMQHMNARYDDLDPKKGAALSATETLVSIHAMTMLVDILAQTQLDQMASHVYIE